MNLSIIGGTSADKIIAALSQAADNVTVSKYASFYEFIETTTVRTVVIDRLLIMQDAYLANGAEAPMQLEHLMNYVWKQFPEVRIVSLGTKPEVLKTFSETIVSDLAITITITKASHKLITDLATMPIDQLRKTYDSLCVSVQGEATANMVNLNPTEAAPKKPAKPEKRGLFGRKKKDNSSNNAGFSPAAPLTPGQTQGFGSAAQNPSDPFGSGANSGNTNPFASGGNNGGSSNPFASGGNSNGSSNPFANSGSSNPFANSGSSNPFATGGSNSFESSDSTNNPFGNQSSDTNQSSNPFGEQPSNPFGEQASNPFGSQPSNPFGEQASNPFGEQASNPFDNTPTRDSGFNPQSSNQGTSQSSNPFGGFDNSFGESSFDSSDSLPQPVQFNTPAPQPAQPMQTNEFNPSQPVQFDTPSSQPAQDNPFNSTQNANPFGQEQSNPFGATNSQGISNGFDSVDEITPSPSSNTSWDNVSAGFGMDGNDIEEFNPAPSNSNNSPNAAVAGAAVAGAAVAGAAVAGAAVAGAAVAGTAVAGAAVANSFAPEGYSDVDEYVPKPRHNDFTPVGVDTNQQSGVDMSRLTSNRGNAGQYNFADAAKLPLANRRSGQSVEEIAAPANTSMAGVGIYDDAEYSSYNPAPRVVERVVEKAVYIDSGTETPAQTLLDANKRVTIIVTGDRRSGVTTTCLTLAQLYAKRYDTLLVDLDTETCGGQLYQNIEILAGEEENIQNGILRAKNPTLLGNLVHHDNSYGFDYLYSLSGNPQPTSQDLAGLQNALIAQSRYQLTIVDCPWSKLKFLSDLAMKSKIFICVDSDITGCHNTIELLNDLPLGDRILTAIDRAGGFVAKAGTSPDNLKRNMAWISETFDSKDHDFSTLRVAGSADKNSIFDVMKTI